MKKLLCLALAAMLCLALAACAAAEGNWKIAILTGTTSQGEEEFRAAERAHVAGLAASRGIKDRAVQLHEPAVFTLLAGEHARLQPPGVRVRFIDADRVQGFPLRFSVFLLFYHKITKNKRDFSAVSLDKRAARQYDKR